MGPGWGLRWVGQNYPTFTPLLHGLPPDPWQVDLQLLENGVASCLFLKDVAAGPSSLSS